MNPMMAMMAANAALLADAFNDSNLDRTRDNVDVVFKVGRTGGLADGRSYIGNPLLDSEVSREINLGSNWQSRKAWFAPQIFYKDIADYIQGIPSTNMTANMVANMMTGAPALEFANVDAEIYGIDLAWGYYVTDRIVVDGILTRVRGRRTDVADNLYRLAPMNGRVGLTYETERWSGRIEAIAYARQNEVASYNGERSTAGWATVNAALRWELGENLSLSASVANLLDKRYQDHLDGINRVLADDVPVGERLFGLGRNLQVGFRVTW